MCTNEMLYAHGHAPNTRQSVRCANEYIKLVLQNKMSAMELFMSEHGLTSDDVLSREGMEAVGN